MRRCCCRQCYSSRAQFFFCDTSERNCNLQTATWELQQRKEQARWAQLIVGLFGTFIGLIGAWSFFGVALSYLRMQTLGLEYEGRILELHAIPPKGKTPLGKVRFGRIEFSANGIVQQQEARFEPAYSPSIFDENKRLPSEIRIRIHPDDSESNVILEVDRTFNEVGYIIYLVTLGCAASILSALAFVNWVFLLVH